MSRRCLICADINPCSRHSDREQDDELYRNMRVSAQIIHEKKKAEKP